MSHKRSRHLVDPDLAPMLDLVPDTPLTADQLPAMRAMPSVFPVSPEAVSVSEMEVRTIPGPEGAPEVGVVIYRPRELQGPLPCILHIHGGGFVTGRASGLEGVHRPLVAELGCVLVSVDYRLAPETPFPGAIEDCWAALAWIFDQGADIGVDTTRVGVMGESAGGGLAAALALLARDRGGCPLAFQHLIFPMLDDRICVATDPHPYTGEFVWTAQKNHFGWSALLGRPPGGEGVSPYAAPARAESLADLPPAFIATVGLDLFLEEDIDYARRLMRAGVPVELHVYPGAFHGFQLVRDAAVTRTANRDSLEALRRMLRRKGP